MPEPTPEPQQREYRIKYSRGRGWYGWDLQRLVDLSNEEWADADPENNAGDARALAVAQQVTEGNDEVTLVKEVRFMLCGGSDD